MHADRTKWAWWRADGGYDEDEEDENDEDDDDGDDDDEDGDEVGLDLTVVACMLIWLQGDDRGAHMT